MKNLSSPFPKNSAATNSKVEIVIIGNAFTASVAALAFAEEGAVPRVYVTGENPPTDVRLPISVGNGEAEASARLIFGDELAGKVWDFSRRNLARANDEMADRKVAHDLSGVVWFPDEKLTEGGTFAPADFVAAAEARAGQFSRVRRLKSLRSEGALKTMLQVDVETTEASIVVIVDDVAAVTLVSSLRDKIIPVTLSSFNFVPSSSHECPVRLFNKGIDYAIAEPGSLRLGSYRNLFEDRAAGIHTVPDEVTLKGVTKFFTDQKWITDSKPRAGHVSIESITCDGLPVVGALAEFPGVYVAGGFAARTPNFIFEVCHVLAGGILGRRDFAPLSLFSTKRFI